jgi:NADPH2:quinone reductase
LFDYYALPEERTAGVARLFAMLESGAVRADIRQRYALEDAAEAHRAIEAGETTGSTILVP